MKCKLLAIIMLAAVFILVGCTSNVKTKNNSSFNTDTLCDDSFTFNDFADDSIDYQYDDIQYDIYE